MQMCSIKGNKQEKEACRAGRWKRRQMWVRLLDILRREDKWFMGWIMGWRLNPFCDIQIRAIRKERGWRWGAAAPSRLPSAARERVFIPPSAAWVASLLPQPTEWHMTAGRKGSEKGDKGEVKGRQKHRKEGGTAGSAVLTWWHGGNVKRGCRETSGNEVIKYEKWEENGKKEGQRKMEDGWSGQLHTWQICVMRCWWSADGWENKECACCSLADAIRYRHMSLFTPLHTEDRSDHPNLPFFPKPYFPSLYFTAVTWFRAWVNCLHHPLIALWE